MGSGNVLLAYTLNFEIIESETSPIGVPFVPPVPPPATPPVEPPPVPASAIQFTLYNAVTDQKIMDITNGSIVDLKKINVGIPQNLNIESIYTGETKSGSTTFTPNGDMYSRIEGGDRVALCGNSGANFATCPVFALGLKLSRRPQIHNTEQTERY